MDQYQALDQSVKVSWRDIHLFSKSTNLKRIGTDVPKRIVEVRQTFDGNLVDVHVHTLFTIGPRLVVRHDTLLRIGV